MRWGESKQVNVDVLVLYSGDSGRVFSWLVVVERWLVGWVAYVV